MSENTPEAPVSDNQKSVRQSRHEAVDSLNAARAAALFTMPQNDTVDEIRASFNGAISSILRGKPGFSQREQARRLDRAATKVEAAIEALPAQIEAIKAEAQALFDAAMENYGNDVTEQARAAADTLRSAQDFAKSRDFDAWQAKKGNPVGTIDTKDDVYPQPAGASAEGNVVPESGDGSDDSSEADYDEDDFEE